MGGVVAISESPPEMAGGGRGAVAIFGVAPAGAAPTAELPRVRRRWGAPGRAPRSGITLRVGVGSDGNRRYGAGEALPGVPAAAPGARLCLRAAAERPRGAPGTRADRAPLRSPPGRGDDPPRRARGRDWVLPPLPGKLRGGRDPTRPDAGGCVGRGGRGRRPPHSAPRPAPGRAAPGGSEGGKKKKDGEEGLQKTTSKTPFLADFDFTSVSRSRPGLRSGAAAWSSLSCGSPGAGKRRGGSIPILPRGERDQVRR